MKKKLEFYEGDEAVKRFDSALNKMFSAPPNIKQIMAEDKKARAEARKARLAAKEKQSKKL